MAFAIEINGKAHVEGLHNNFLRCDRSAAMPAPSPPRMSNGLFAQILERHLDAVIVKFCP
jgi:hypothetical protein